MKFRVDGFESVGTCRWCSRAMAGAEGKEKEERFAFAGSIGVPIEIAGYREHGLEAHATKCRRKLAAV